jgi:hypothetical protein
VRQLRVAVGALANALIEVARMRPAPVSKMPPLRIGVGNTGPQGNLPPS